MSSDIVVSLVSEKRVLEERIKYLTRVSRVYDDGYRRGFTWWKVQIKPFINFRSGGVKSEAEALPEWLTDVVRNALRIELEVLRTRLELCERKLSMASSAISVPTEEN